MKPVDRQLLYLRAGPMRLYKRDLEQILALLSRNGERPVVIRDEEHEFDSIDEVRETHGPVIDHLTLETAQRDVAIRFEKDGTFAALARRQDLWAEVSAVERYIDRNRLFRWRRDFKRSAAHAAAVMPFIVGSLLVVPAARVPAMSLLIVPAFVLMFLGVAVLMRITTAPFVCVTSWS